MLTPAFLLAMNGTLFVLVLFTLLMFAVYVGREILAHGFDRMRLQAGISIAVFVAGEAVIRGWVFWWRRLDIVGADVSWMNNHPVLAIGAALQIVGAICMLRVFAPDHWGRNVWILSSLIAVGASTAFLYL